MPPPTGVPPLPEMKLINPPEVAALEVKPSSATTVAGDPEHRDRDVAPLLAYTRSIIYLEDGEYVIVNDREVQLFAKDDTPIERAVDDYVSCLKGVYPFASYVTVNISSPNTKGLRDLQAAEQLQKLLSTLKAEQAKLSKKHKKHVPLVLKIAPDLDLKAIREIASLTLENNFEGIIATNTTISRDAVRDHALAKEAGGLSGKPLFSPSTEVLRELARALKGNIPVIGVGGILSGADARAKMNAGASLVQIYTGFIYRGPDLIRDAVQAITAK